MDTKSTTERSINMSRIKSVNTKPEILVRNCLRNLGINYRIHKKTLPGKPDIVISKYKTVIFVNGCFWHQHQGCKRQFIPKSNIEYWKNKLQRNIYRFDEQVGKLKEAGFKVYAIWECEVKNPHVLQSLLVKIIHEIS